MLTFFSKSSTPQKNIHRCCSEYAPALLAGSGHRYLAELLPSFMSFIHQGSQWTDQGLRNLSHFYHPLQHSGLPGVHHAADELTNNLNIMDEAFKERHAQRYFFHLGIVLHLIQDLCVPHHAIGCLLQGHHHYESWASNHFQAFIPRRLIAVKGRHPLEILESNALRALSHEMLLHQPTEEQMKRSTAELLPRAFHSTAAVLLLLQNDIVSLAECSTSIPHPLLMNKVV
ncbi:hypothetical protein [Anoxynatronum buryatiense]|uniref:Phospholipase C n=1 Tax=Anoxynatronum buryatiense TaxID=489973 RepID=A0AA45WTK4_9CLOT|nr:hypothetical protein [Anoxynatronum buryatiense]SMP43530.1 phospholipase C [Anoxynatronum buryatiense]